MPSERRRNMPYAARIHPVFCVPAAPNWHAHAALRRRRLAKPGWRRISRGESQHSGLTLDEHRVIAALLHLNITAPLTLAIVNHSRRIEIENDGRPLKIESARGPPVNFRSGT